MLRWAFAERERVDVAIVDYQLGARNGLWGEPQAQAPAGTAGGADRWAHTAGVLAVAAVVAEADAIVSKGSRGTELYEVTRSVARGRQVMPPVPQWLGDALRRRRDYEEQAIFGMLLAGIKPAEVAERSPSLKLDWSHTCG